MGQRSLKVIESGIFGRLCMVSYYCPIATFSVRRTVLERFDYKNAVTLETGLGVHECHWKCHHSIQSLWLPIDVP